MDSGKNPAPDPAWSALWNTAYRKYFRLWTTLARSAELSDDEAKDIVHTVVTGIIAEPTREFVSLEHARNYVAKSVLNRVKVYKVRRSRRSGWEEEAEMISSVTPDEYPGDERRIRDALRKVIRGLVRRDFNILKLRFYSGFTLIQVSEILGMPISTIASREAVILRRIREKLRKKGF